MLTGDQQTVADAVLRKLFEGQDQQIIISGPAGTGKTFLIDYILKDILHKYIKTAKICGQPLRFVENEPQITATTNKAVGVLQQELHLPYPRSTIESALGLVVTGDMTKGTYKLTPGKNGLRHMLDQIVIIDEASMIDKQLYNYIQKGCLGCFIIYIGDDCQLPAVKEGNTPLIWTLGLPEYKLTTLVRQADNQEIAELCGKLRDTVKTIAFPRIHTSSSIKQILETENQKKFLKNTDYNDTKILTYTNAKAIQYNEWLMKEKHGYEAPGYIYAGEDYIVNDYFASMDPYFKLSAESRIRITKILDKIVQSYNGADCTFLKVDAATDSGMHVLWVPEDKVFFRKWLKYIAGFKDWQRYFWWKEKIVDIRGVYACTIHKAQGSTYEKVIIDADDFRTCTNPAIAARLLYVAVSRAKQGITFLGKLPKRYGEIIWKNRSVYSTTLSQT